MTVTRRAFVRGIGAAVTAGTVVGGRGVTLGASAVPAPPVAPVPIRLTGGGNPYGPSPRALEAARSALADAAVPAASAVTSLQEAIAAHHAVPAPGVVVGAGSSAVLRAAVRAFCGPGRPLVVATPGGTLMTAIAADAGVRIVEVPLAKTLAHDLPAMLDAARAGGVLYVCNPATPTGTLTPRRDLDALIAHLPADTILVVDEAYADYVDPSPDIVSYGDRPLVDSRLVVTRTFSTAYGLQGLRVGYALTSGETARRLAAQGVADGVSVTGARAAVAALADAPYLRESVDRAIDARQEFLNQVNARMVRAIDSQASFVLIDTGREAAAVLAHFERHGILLAAPPAGLPHQIQVAIGRDDAMQAFWRVWDLQPAGPMVM